MNHWLERCATVVITGFTRLLTGVQAIWLFDGSSLRNRVYYANHTSHGDFVLVWISLPPMMRARTRPVAGADYWQRSGVRRFLGSRVFRALLIDRARPTRSNNPLESMTGALDGGDSLIIFPEGTRNTGDEKLLPFRNGLFHLARSRPQVELVPVWIDNLNRVLPKGHILPVPLLCRVTFGQPLTLAEGESREVFIARARQALLALAPSGD